MKINNKGVTIIENFIALVLIGVIVVPAVAMAFSSSQRYIALARHHYRATCYAREALERYINGIPQRTAAELEIDSTTGLTASSDPVIADDGRNIIVSIRWDENIMAAEDQVNREETVAFRRF